MSGGLNGDDSAEIDEVRTSRPGVEGAAADGATDDVAVTDAAARDAGDAGDLDDAHDAEDLGDASVEADAWGARDETDASGGSTGESSAGALEVEVETELKFDAPRRWSMPRLDRVAGIAAVEAPQRLTQTATYLDTLDLDLLRGRHTLRRRTGGTDAGWHLKTPGDGAGRVEHRLPLGRVSIVPSELRDLVADLVGDSALVPVAQLRTRRTRRAVTDEAGAVLVLVEEDAVEATTYVDGERVHRWREVEVELVHGTPSDLETVSAALVASGLVASPHPSKLGRALDEPLSRPVPGKDDDRSAGAVVLHYLSAQVGVLQGSENRLREDAKSAVHKARVATRRLRSTLRTYRALLDRVETDPLREEITWLTGVLGEPRDGEVQLARIGGLLDSLEPDLVVDGADVTIRETLEAEHAQAHARMVAVLDSSRYERLMADLTDLLLRPPFLPDASRPATEVLPGLVTKASRAVVTQAKRAAAMPEGPERDEAVHDIRKLAKAARYAAEAAGRSAGSSAKDVVGAFTDLQEALGDHQDSVVSRGVVMRLADQARKAGRDTFTYGVLAEREYALARSVEARYVPLLQQARKAAKKLR